jgi:hypothetical protein
MEKCGGKEKLLTHDEKERLAAIKTYADHIRTVYNRHDPFRKQDAVDPATEH